MSTDTTQVVGGTIVSKSGGDLELDPEKPMEVHGGIEQTATGAAFGPLEISAYPESTARVGGLEFLEEESFVDSLFGSSGGSGLFGALIAFGAIKPEDEDDHVTRRDVIKATGLGGLAIASSQAAVAATTETKAHKAQFEAIANPAGIRTRVFDRVDGVLPTDTPYYAYVNGEEYGRFSPASDDSYGDVLPTKTGTVTIGREGAAGGILSSLRSDKTVVYAGISLSESTTDAQAGDELIISTNDILVETVSKTGGSATTLELNGVSIPHGSESRISGRGYYEVSDDRLVYSAGSDAPSGSSVTLTVYADRVDEILDDVSRRVD